MRKPAPTILIYHRYQKQDIKICVFLKLKTQKENFIKKFNNLRETKTLF